MCAESSHPDTVRKAKVRDLHVVLFVKKETEKRKEGNVPGAEVQSRNAPASLFRLQIPMHDIVEVAVLYARDYLLEKVSRLGLGQLHKGTVTSSSQEVWKENRLKMLTLPFCTM